MGRRRFDSLKLLQVHPSVRVFQWSPPESGGAFLGHCRQRRRRGYNKRHWHLEFATGNESVEAVGTWHRPEAVRRRVGPASLLAVTT